MQFWSEVGGIFIIEDSFHVVISNTWYFYNIVKIFKVTSLFSNAELFKVETDILLIRWSKWRDAINAQKGNWKDKSI